MEFDAALVDVGPLAAAGTAEEFGAVLMAPGLLEGGAVPVCASAGIDPATAAQKPAVNMRLRI
jgi:hypothetical protein